MPKIVIPPPYRGPTGGNAELVVEGATVRECLEAVEQKFPGFLGLMLDEKNDVRMFNTLFLNGNKLQGDVLAAPTDGGDSLEIVSSVAGG